MAALPARFRMACHWRLYVRAIVGAEGLEPIEAPTASMPQAQRTAINKARLQLVDLRKRLYPEGD